MDTLVLILYEIILLLLLLVSGPFLLFKKKVRPGLTQKLGFISPDLKNRLENLKNPIWFHAVSVGEFNAAWPFITAFHERFPNQSIIISTTTAAGQELANKRASSIATLIYFPFDLPWIVSTWLDTVKPSLVAIIETELWPCFTESCYQRKIPIIVLNGRVSPKSHRWHQILKPLYAPLLRKLSLIGVQSKAEAERYQSIGGNKLTIAIHGNLKYDGLSAISIEEINLLRSKLNINPNDLVLVAGSTHEGEESTVLNLLTKLTDLKLIIAPRHPERFERVAQIISSAGFRVRKYSKEESFEKDNDVYLLDTIGVLSKFYSIATVAFVGGTLVKVGGHNLVEPYTYGVPVICGPSIYKTKDTANILLERNALLLGKDSKEVEEKLLLLLKDSPKASSMGQNGKIWLIENQGAVKRALLDVEALLAKPNPQQTMSNIL